jgi:hypothetical protein
MPPGEPSVWMVTVPPLARSPTTNPVKPTACANMVFMRYPEAGSQWMEFHSLHNDAKVALEAAAEDAMMSVQATNALRALFVRAKLL